MLAWLTRLAGVADPTCWCPVHRHITTRRLAHGRQASIDTLLEEGRAGSPKMMSVGLHQRTIGHTKFAPGLKKLLDYIQSHGNEIWVTKRSDISKHWWDTNPGGLRPGSPK